MVKMLKYHINLKSNLGFFVQKMLHYLPEISMILNIIKEIKDFSMCYHARKFTIQKVSNGWTTKEK